MKYIVVELQTDKNGSVGDILTAYDSQSEAESKYYAVLSTAAVSSVPEHAAVLMTSTGGVLEGKCYTHGE